MNNYLHLLVHGLFKNLINYICLISHVMADGAPGILFFHFSCLFSLHSAITSVQQKIFSESRRLMCWSHMIRSCRKHRNFYQEI